MKKTPLNRGTKQMKRSGIKRKSDNRDWYNMRMDTWREAGECCEWCGKPLPSSTPPAHIIARDKNDPTLDEIWNLALMDWTGWHKCTCHKIFDDNRGKAYQDMLAEDEPCKLLKRILAHPRLKEHFDRRLAVWEVKQEQMGRDRE